MRKIVIALALIACSACGSVLQDMGADLQTASKALAVPCPQEKDTPTCANVRNAYAVTEEAYSIAVAAEAAGKDIAPLVEKLGKDLKATWDQIKSLLK